MRIIHLAILCIHQKCLVIKEKISKFNIILIRRVCGDTLGSAGQRSFSPSFMMRDSELTLFLANAQSSSRHLCCGLPQCSSSCVVPLTTEWFCLELIRHATDFYKSLFWERSIVSNSVKLTKFYFNTSLITTFASSVKYDSDSTFPRASL